MIGVGAHQLAMADWAFLGALQFGFARATRSRR